MRASRVLIASLGLAIAVAGAAPAAAQPAAAADRIRVHVDVGAQLSSNDFDTSTARVLYLENAVVATSYPVRRGLLAHGGVSLRVAGHFSVGVTVSSLMAAHDGGVSAALPHPFFFRTPRTVTGTASGLSRDELAAHVQGIYALQPRAGVDVALSAGPSFFRVRQDVVADIAFSDLYPYDTAAFTSAMTQRVSANAIGYNAGADVSVRLSRHAGVGGGVRFSRAVVALAVPNGGGTVAADAGGAGITGGLRLYF